LCCRFCTGSVKPRRRIAKVIRSLILTPRREWRYRLISHPGLRAILSKTLAVYGGVNIEGQPAFCGRVLILSSQHPAAEDHMQRRSIDLKFVKCWFWMRPTDV
jgi:hypothetical protein